MENNKKTYNAVVINSSKNLSGKEKVALKNFADMVELDNATQETDLGVIIDIDYVATVHVYNEKSDTTEYDKFVYVDKDGTMYISGSESLYRQYESIAEDMEDEEEPWSIKVIRKDSKNYKGKQFLTCVLV